MKRQVSPCKEQRNNEVQWTRPGSGLGNNSINSAQRKLERNNFPTQLPTAAPKRTSGESPGKSNRELANGFASSDGHVTHNDLIILSP